MAWLWKKKKPEKSESREFAPNTKLYSGLLIGAFFLTFISLLFDDKKTLFTVWTSISCGGIASIVVAWLIDDANCRQATMKATKNREILLANLYRDFENGLQLLIFECTKMNRCADSKKWFEWIECAYEQADDDPKKISFFNRSLAVFLDDIAEQVFAIKGQEAILLGSGIICEEDIDALSSILKICDVSKMGFSEVSAKECFQNYQTYCGLIRRFIDYAPSLCKINSTMIEPMLYKQQLELQSEKSAPKTDDNNVDEER